MHSYLRTNSRPGRDEDWLARVKEESARRVALAHYRGYEPQSPTKKLEPWGSGTEKRVVTLDKKLEE
jgi:exonuclease 3'-5' domain-containing protein 1